MQRSSLSSSFTNALPSLTDLHAERARRSLSEFVRQAWHVVEPATLFKPGFHLDAICQHLAALLNGDIRRLLINLPPRHGKSRLASVLFPAWVWTSRPELRWLFASYAQSLATRDSLTTRRLIESPWYRERWGHVFELTSDQNLKARFENNRGGMRIATSVGGSATGEGGDLIVVDDAHKIEEAHSAAQRDAVLEWFDGSSLPQPCDLPDPERRSASPLTGAAGRTRAAAACATPAHSRAAPTACTGRPSASVQPPPAPPPTKSPRPQRPSGAKTRAACRRAARRSLRRARRAPRPTYEMSYGSSSDRAARRPEPDKRADNRSGPRHASRTNADGAPRPLLDDVAIERASRHM
jgi:hypothetical protein